MHLVDYSRSISILNNYLNKIKYFNKIFKLLIYPISARHRHQKIENFGILLIAKLIYRTSS